MPVLIFDAHKSEVIEPEWGLSLYQNTLACYHASIWFWKSRDFICNGISTQSAYNCLVLLSQNTEPLTTRHSLLDALFIFFPATLCDTHHAKVPASSAFC